MRHFFAALLCFILLILTACGSPPGSSAASALDAYFRAFTAGEEETMTALVCPDWQSDALLEWDAFQGVETSLQGLSCSQAGTEGEAALVTCRGKILAKYGSDTQEFDLSGRTYRLEKVDDRWQVCGYTVK